MRKKQFLIEYKFVQDKLILLDDDKRNVFILMFNKFVRLDQSISSIKRLTGLIYDILSNNSSDYEDLYHRYINSKSVYDRKLIRFGEDNIERYKNKLKSRPKHKVISHWTVDYWVDKGYSLDDANRIISDIQTRNVNKRSRDTYKKFQLKCKHSKSYWTNLGYDDDEAEILRQPFLAPMKNDLESYIVKYGIDLGYEKWVLRCDNYKKAMYSNLENRRTGGYVSKESLKFFVPLYKFCRKLGICRSDIYFGINGSREFFIRDNSLGKNGGKFYDFTIPKLNIIVEYHGIFWHPRERNLWKNPFINYDMALDSDNYKKMLAINFGMDYHIVWSDSVLKDSLKK